MTVGLPCLLVVAVMAARHVVGQPTTRPVSATTVPPRAVVPGAPALVSVTAEAGAGGGAGGGAGFVAGSCGRRPGARGAGGGAARGWRAARGRGRGPGAGVGGARPAQ